MNTIEVEINGMKLVITKHKKQEFSIKQFIAEKEQLAKVIQLYMSEQQKQASKNLSDSSKDATTPESFEKQDSKSRFATDVLAHIQMVDGVYVMGLSKINRLSQTVVTAAIEFSSSNIKFLAKSV
jgi:hypothetical protein